MQCFKLTLGFLLTSERKRVNHEYSKSCLIISIQLPLKNVIVKSQETPNDQTLRESQRKLYIYKNTELGHSCDA